MGQTLHRRRSTRNQQTYEKMFNIFSNKRNANQNYTKIPSHADQNGNFQEYKQRQVLERMWGKRYTHILLVGLQISAATLESSVEIPQELGIEPLFDPSIPLLRLYPKDFKSAYYRDTARATTMFIAAQFTVARLWNQPRCMSLVL